MRTILYLILFILIFLSFSCNSDKNPESKGLLESISEAAVVADELGFETIADPNENAFSVNMPKGWTTKVSLERLNSITRNCGVSVSPDGKTRIFFGDPSFPSFNLPNPQMGMYEGAPSGNPLSQVSRFIPSEIFFNDYAKMAFGTKSKFKITGITENTELKNTYEKAFAKSGVNSTITASCVAFEFYEGAEKYLGKINGVSFLMDNIWGVDCNGYTTTENGTQDAEKILAEISTTFKTNPQWREKENNAFASRMEADRQQSSAYMQQMTNAHNQRMNDMNNNFNAHQQRMGNLQSSYDEQNQNYQNTQNSNDVQHRKNIDVIRGEEQVRNGNQVAKVEAGYNHYYVNQSSGQYYGTNSEPQSVPENYEKWEVDN